MTASVRSGSRSTVWQPPHIPRISTPAQRPENARRAELRERNQIDHLVWRCALFLKDAGASKRRRQEFERTVKGRWAQGASYEEMCGLIEQAMNGFLAKQSQNIQTIFNERQR